MPLVTIIIPAYNVEKYIDECLESAIQQTYYNIEIIIVDDGSTDGTSEICDYWGKKDNRITVIHKQNEGLGMARNSGLLVAHGVYIEFLDSDDFLDAETVNVLVNEMERNTVDAVFCNYIRFNASFQKMGKPREYKTVLTRKEIKAVCLDMVGSLPEDQHDFNFEMSSCMALYKASVVRENRLLFPSEREYISEDLIFNIHYLMCSKGFTVIPDYLYHYRCNEASLTKRYSTDRFLKCLSMHQYLWSLLVKFDCTDSLELRLDRYLLSMVRVCICQIAKSDVPQKIKAISAIINNVDVRKVISRYPYWKNPIKQRIFNFFIDKKKSIVLYVLGRCK